MSPFHLQVAEAGKRHHLGGRHGEALARYRLAMRMASGAGARPVYLHHYAECILDALDASGARLVALEMVERALEDIPASAGAGSTAALAAASLVRRRIVLLFKLNRTEEGDAALACAMPDPFLAAIVEARRRRLSLSPAWLDALRERHGGATVTRASLREDDARSGEILFRTEAIHA